MCKCERTKQTPCMQTLENAKASVCELSGLELTLKQQISYGQTVELEADN